MKQAAIYFVGNKLMLDDGIGPAAYDLFLETFEVGEGIRCFDVGCMSMDMITMVDKCDLIITVDAVDGTKADPGTVFRFSPEDMARHNCAMASLHDLKLVDLFDAASLLGFESDGVCLGMQVLNMEPEEYVIGLTEPCYEKLPLLVETIAAELHNRGFEIRRKNGEPLS